MKRVRYSKNVSDRDVVDSILDAAKPHASEYHNGHGAYDKKYPGIAKFLCRRGATLAELADAFDVTTRAINNWLAKYPEFGEAVEEAKDQFDPRVERSLAERALGYSVDEVQYIVCDKEIHEKVVRKHYPPDVTACIFWLKNRKPEQWRDVHRIDLETKQLPSSNELRAQLVAEFKDLFEQGLLALPKPMKTINGKGS